MKSNFQQIQNNYNNHAAGEADKHTAQHITYSGVVSGASNVKQGIDNIKNSYNGHINGDSDKHAAEHITFASNRLTLPDDNVKNAIETVDMRIEQIIQEQSLDPNKDVEVVSSRVSAVYGEFDTLPERLDNTDNIVNDLNAKIDAPEYSAPQEATSSVITLPNHVVEGQFSDITLKGNTRINYADGTADQFVEDKIQDNKYYIYYADLTCTSETGAVWLWIQVVGGNTIPSGNAYSEGVIGLNISKRVGIKLKVVNKPDTCTLKGIDYINGGTGTIKNAGFEEITEEEYNNLTVNEILQKYKYISTGVVSTESVRVTACGKNLLDGITKIGKFLNPSDGKSELTQVGVYSPKFYPVKSNTNYTLKHVGTATTQLYLFWYDINKNYIKFDVINAKSLTSVSPNNAAYVRWGIANVPNNDYSVELYKPQLEEGTIATEYEEYKGAEAYIDGELRSLPNGVYDEKSVITGEGTQRTNKIVLNGSENWYIAYTGENHMVFTGDVITGIKDWTILITNGLPWGGGAGDYTKESNQIIYNTTGKYFEVNILKSHLASYDATGFKAWLATNPVTIIYQLATEIPSKEQAQPLIAFPGGHLIIETGIIREEQIYSSSGITVKNTQRPIKEIESIWKIDGKTETPVDISKAVYTVGATTFTITGAQVGEKYKYVYKTTADSILPTVRFSYPLNISASISELNKIQQALSAELGDVWLTLLPLADKELGMYMITAISAPATATSEEIANKINEIINVWKG